MGSGLLTMLHSLVLTRLRVLTGFWVKHYSCSLTSCEVSNPDFDFVLVEDLLEESCWGALRLDWEWRKPKHAWFDRAATKRPRNQAPSVSTHPIFESDFDCLTGKNRPHANPLLSLLPLTFKKQILERSIITKYFTVIVIDDITQLQCERKREVSRFHLYPQITWFILLSERMSLA